MTQDTTPEETHAIENDSPVSAAEVSLTNESASVVTAQPEAEQQLSEAEQTEQEAPSKDDIIEQLRVELTAAQIQAGEYLDQLQRTAADFQNSRRRQEKQLSEEIERANGDLIAGLLPALDDLDLAFSNLDIGAKNDAEDGTEHETSSEVDTHTGWLEGFRQIQKKLLDVLAEEGVSIIDTTGMFDPMRHEAISNEPNNDVESGHIIAAIRAGYEYKGRVLRPALVRVAM